VSTPGYIAQAPGDERQSEHLIRMPDNISFVDAAALPVAYGTAHRMLVTHQMVAKGDKVLPLEQAVEGLRLIQDREAIGKVVVTP
jgi:hypothetical protein